MCYFGSIEEPGSALLSHVIAFSLLNSYPTVQTCQFSRWMTDVWHVGFRVLSLRFQACIMDWHTGWLSQHQDHQPRFAKIIQVDKTSKNELSHGHVLRVWFLALLGLRNSSGHLPCDISWNFALRWKRRLVKNLMAFRVRSLSNAESSTEIRPWSGIHGWPGASKVHSFLLEQISKCALVCWKLRSIVGNCACCAFFF